MLEGEGDRVSNLELLLNQYESYITAPWQPAKAAPQRVIFVIYDPKDERRLRARVGEFELATGRAKKGWLKYDVTDSFAQWMAAHEYRESYFEAPTALSIALVEFEKYVSGEVREVLNNPDADENAVVAILGVASLFGYMSVAKLVESVEKSVRGRLLVFFPGQHDDAVYRLLDARDGWNYHAVPITARE